MNKTHIIPSCFVFLSLLLSSAMIISCDSMEEDGVPSLPTVTISDDEVLVVSNHAGYIDLFSKIKTNGKIKVNIASHPSNGTLNEISTGFLRYKPGPMFKNGKDVFTFAVHSEANQFISNHTVNIVVTDSTEVPCGIYPKDDWIYSSGTPIEVPVLNNDLICWDSTDVLVEIYKPGNSFPPFLGNAVVTNDNAIQYTATVGEEVPVIVDTVVYKVSRKSDPNIFGFATLFINASTQCWPSLSDYSVTATSEKVGVDSLFLWVVPSVPICGRDYNDGLAVTTQPKNGTAVVEQNWIWYIFDHVSATAQVSDSLSYKLCDGTDCLEAKLKIKIN